MPSTRTIHVEAQRLPGWLGRFEAAQGRVEIRPGQDGLLVEAASGARAELLPPWPADGRPGRGSDDVGRLVSLAGQARTLGLLLARRGGYAVGVCREGRLLGSKTGSGNARRAPAVLAGTAAVEAARLFAAFGPEYLVLGGDRTLAGQAAARKELAPWAGLARLRLLDVADPKAAVLAQAARDAAAVLVRVTVP